MCRDLRKNTQVQGDKGHSHEYCAKKKTAKKNKNWLRYSALK